MSNEKQESKNMDRRSLLKGAGVAAGATVAAVAALSSTAAAHCGTCAPKPKKAAAKPTKTCCPAKGKLMFKNSDFYTAGKFDVEKAKDGIIAMCKFHGYPVFPGFRENLWVSDYGLGQYTKLGLAAYMFQNKNDGKDDTYMLMDLFLVPGQMLPEHWHLEGDNNIVKNEGWLVRWGKSYIVGEGKDNLAKFPIKIPKLHMAARRPPSTSSKRARGNSSRSPRSKPSTGNGQARRARSSPKSPTCTPTKRSATRTPLRTNTSARWPTAARQAEFALNLP